MMLELGQFNLRLVVSLVDFLIVVRVKASLSGEVLVRRSLTAEAVEVAENAINDGHKKMGEKSVVRNRWINVRSRQSRLTESRADDCQRHKGCKDTAFNPGLLQKSRHYNEGNEQERPNDEGGQGADQDASERFEEVARDVLVLTPAPSELVQLDAKKTVQ
ncbi:uncharacterized protein UBRO_13675 [Ustilago bromivora]|uniref:Uncharacterized protein n=1 Tax=Ustilago bromivora TaxID=307758 RepID=A0A1K0GB35_9BASI|nr:uncharacterized protein UBRO_13675 [Ustilago bromivora]